MKIRGTENQRSLRDRVRGCLLGVAVGDALGAPFEHILPGQQNQVLEAAGGQIHGFHGHGGLPPGSWTDDTAMTLASCHAFLEMEQRGTPLEQAFREAFADCIVSQECRSPGKTVKYAATFGEADVNSWANGALMRISPSGLYAFLRGMNQQETLSTAYRVARLTHGHPMATYPAVAMVRAVVSILQGDQLVPKFDAVGLSCGEAVLKDRASRIHHHPREYVPKYKVPLDEIPATTGLWMWRQVVEVCLGLVPNDPWVLEERCPEWQDLPGFEEGVLRTVNSSADRDTAGAVAGALLGTYWGESGIPEGWRTSVEKADRITALADELIETCQRIERETPEPAESGASISRGHGTQLNTNRETVPADGTTEQREPLGHNMRMEHEQANGIESEPGWEPVPWDDRHTLRQGDVVRAYVRPYMTPNDTFYWEYRLQSDPYTFICAHYRVRGARVEIVDLPDDSHISLKDMFRGAEVWVKRNR